jgi:hypothetical protein
MLARLEQPSERSTDIGRFDAEASDPTLLIGTVQLRLSTLDETSDIGGVCISDCDQVLARVQTFPRVRMSGLQNREAPLVVVGRRGQHEAPSTSMPNGSSTRGPHTASAAARVQPPENTARWRNSACSAGQSCS